MSTYENLTPEELDELERTADELRDFCDLVDEIAASITDEQKAEALARVMASVKNRQE